MIKYFKRRLENAINFLIDQRLRKYYYSDQTYTLKQVQDMKGAFISTSNDLNKQTKFLINGLDWLLHIEEGVGCREYCCFTLYDRSKLILRKNVFLNNYCS